MGYLPSPTPQHPSCSVVGTEKKAGLTRAAANVLSAPDFTKQVFADTDASDDGKGCVIYQLKDPTKGDALENRAILRYYSKAWGPSMKHTRQASTLLRRRRAVHDDRDRLLL